MQNQYKTRMLSLLTIVIVLLVQSVSVGAQAPIANFLAETHPPHDRQFTIKLKSGINPKSMVRGQSDEIDGEANYRGSGAYPAKVMVTLVNGDIIKIKVVHIIINGHYYFPNATLTNIRVDNEPVGMPVPNPEGLEKVAEVRVGKLNVAPSNPSTKPPDAPNAPVKLNPTGNGQIVVVESPIPISVAYQTIVSLWNIGSWILRSSPKSLPHEKTELVFRFLGIDKVSDMGTEPPKYLITENQFASKEKKQLASKESLKTFLKNCN